LENVLENHPERVIEHAVKGMLPHNRLSAPMMSRLRVFVGETHPYGGQVTKSPAKAAEAGDTVKVVEAEKAE